MTRFYSALVAIICVGCSQPVDIRQLQSYLSAENNGTSRSREINGTLLTVKYYPTDLLVTQELEGIVPDDSTVARFRNKYSAHYYFLLSIASSSNASPGTNAYNKSQLLQTLAFKMYDYAFLTSVADTLRTADFMLNRTYGMGNSTDVLLVFEKAKVIDDDAVDITLKEFGLGTGDQSFSFRTEDLNNVPDLTFTGE